MSDGAEERDERGAGVGGRKSQGALFVVEEALEVAGSARTTLLLSSNNNRAVSQFSVFDPCRHFAYRLAKGLH